MNVLTLRCRAPFAAFRWMQAGVWRGTSPVIPYSAAWGLVLNLAGIESRSDARAATTLVRGDAPALELAVASVRSSERGTLYQQLHSYPVGNSGKELRERAHGTKYWIAPARREFLCGFDALIAVRGDDAVLSRIPAGLRGEYARYGLPFAGDNNLLFDDIHLVEEPPTVAWFERLSAASRPRAGTCRLTVGIDRADASRTTSAIFAPAEARARQPGADAWVWVPHAPALS